MTIRTIFLAAAALTLASAAHAGSISAIYSFGDSLSDVGNIYAYTGGTIPGTPYVNGQFSNGPIWLQTLAGGLGLPALTPSLLGGTDYAYGGADSGATPFHTANASDLTGPTGQIAQYKATHATADPNALYTIWIGANDLRDIPTGATPAAIATDIGVAVSNIDSAIGTLASLGAKNFLVVTVPDLGLTPAAITTSSTAAARAASIGFDSTLVFGSGPVPSLATLGSLYNVSIKVLDSFTLLDGVVANAAAFGFTDVTDACVTGAVNYVGGTACAATTTAQNKYLFWDAIHPTSAGHALVGAAALAVVTPEPGTVSLIFTGLAATVFFARRRR